jgi:hypothetical protein
MNKNKHLFFVVLIGFAIVAIGLLKEKDASSGGDRGIVSTPSDSLDSRIEALGLVEYNQAAFETVENRILALKADSKQSAEHTEMLLENLNMVKQRSLFLSIEKWFKDRCPNGKINILSLAKSVENPIPELKNVIEEYERYESALSCSGELNNFLNQEWSAQEANNLLNRFSSLSDGRKFSNCSEVLQLRSRLQSELGDFEYFVKQVYSGTGNDQDFYNSNATKMDQLVKYSFYYKRVFP